MNLKKKLTSHFINGDKKTNFFQNLIYFSYFIIEILKDKKFIQDPENYKYTNYKNDYINNNKNLFNKSPSRILCELFLLKYLEKNFKKSDEITILDVGCGSCVSIKIFQNYFENFKYFGCDQTKRENWDDIKKKNITLFEHEIGSDFNKDIGKIDLVYSQSVFEHVEYDLSGFKVLNKNFSKAKNLHFIPASYSFINYQKHGYRRYNFKAIKNLEKELSTTIKIYPIGGKNALKYHFNYNNFTKGNNLILSNLLEYENNFKNESEYIDFLVDDVLKYYPIFYAIDY